MAKKESLYQKADKKLHMWAGTIGAIIAIVGALTGSLGWVQSQFTNAVASQVESLKEEMRAADREQALAIMRLELMSLIENNPENVVEIERLGKKYFNPPYNGDSYMSSLYSQYAKEHGLDTSFIIH